MSTLALAMQHISFIVVAMAEIQHRNAALIVIGDEILSGQIQDGATKYLGTWLDTRGHELRSVEIVPDDRAQLKDAFERAIARYHFVFTTGGLGITHDDITIESIASSLGRKVIFHPEILALLASHYGDELDDARRLMARTPEGSSTICNRRTLVPGICIDDRIFLLPGVPVLMRDILCGLEERFPLHAPMMSLRLGIWSEESAFSDKLRNIQAERPQVKIGSYPFWRGRLAGCNIMIRGESEKAVNSAGRAVQAMLASCGLEIFNDGIEE